ncbi:MAG: 2-oxo acid dehydrogenase subunit E2 [Gemmataceae bacterium]|nr:2-oxo acid dehydrogenase subunit E2 [Gemmataceae bacterium]
MASEITLPLLGENIDGGDVVDIKVAPGEEVRQGQALLEVEAEKSTVEVPSPTAGRIAEVLVKKGERVTTGQPLFRIEGGNGASTKPAPPAASEAPKEPAPRKPEPPPKPAEPARTDGARRTAPPAEAPEKIPPAGPATRRLARELGIDLRLVRGTAPSGRVTQEDVKAYVRDLASGAALRGPSPQAPPLPDFERYGPVERRPFESVRRKTAEQVSLAWTLIPHVTQHDLADVTDLEAFRKSQDGKGPKLTVTAFALKAVAIALSRFPQFNASLDLANGQLVLKGYVHLGVAVDTERGLLVPVLRDVDTKSVQQLAKELGDIAQRARDRKVTADEMRGGCFTITNLGGIGGTAFTPIVNWPEVAILGLSRGRLEPVVRDGQVVPRLMLPLSLSYDHRVIDGADAARFTRAVAEMLENPLVMLLHA